MPYYRLFKQDYSQITQNESPESSIRTKFDRVERTLTADEDKIISSLTRWKEHRESATESALNQIRIDPLITQKADKIRLAIKIAEVAAIVLAIATITTVVIAMGIYAAASFEFFITLLFYTCLSRRLAVTPPVFVVPPAVTILGITSIACAGVGIVCYITQGLLNRSSILREDRVQADKNFQEFVSKYLEEKLGFIPKDEDLTDSTLHSIYSEWRLYMEDFSATAASLHSEVELRKALENLA